MRNFIKECQANLIDISGRNNLINFNFKSKNYLDVYQETNDKVFEIAIHKPTEDLEKEKHDALSKIYSKQRECIREKGFNPTAFGFGFFKYKDGDNERFAPILLIKAIVEKDGKGGYYVKRDEGALPFINYAIKEKLKSEFEIIIQDAGDDLNEKLDEIEKYFAGNSFVSIERRVVLAPFNSAKASLYHEAVKYENEILQHDIISTLVSEDRLQDFEITDARTIDKTNTMNFVSPFEFDGSQLEVIKAAKEGKSFVIQGPPGTGKTQTISNIISELIADGKKVLFVAEKKAAIDAVLQKFKSIGLEKAFLDLHDKKIKPKDIIHKIDESFSFFRDFKIKESEKEEIREVFKEAEKHKQKLVARNDLMHDKSFLFGKSPFDILHLINGRFKKYQALDCVLNPKLTLEEFEDACDILENIEDEYLQIVYNKSNPWLQTSFAKEISTEDLEKIKELVGRVKDCKVKIDSKLLAKKQNDLVLQERENYIQEVQFQINENSGQAILTLEKIFGIAKTYQDINNPWLETVFKEKINEGEAKNALLQIENLEDEILRLRENLKLLQASNFQKAFNSFKIIGVKHKIKKKQQSQKIYIKYLNNYFEVGNLHEALRRQKYVHELSNTINFNTLTKELKSLGYESCWNLIKNDLRLDTLKVYHEACLIDKDLLSEIEEITVAQNGDLKSLKDYFEFSDFASITHLELIIKTSKVSKLLERFKALGLGEFWQTCFKQELKEDLKFIFIKTFYEKSIDNFYKTNEVGDLSKVLQKFQNADSKLSDFNKERLKYILKERVANEELEAYANQKQLSNLLSRQRFPGGTRKLLLDYRELIMEIIGCVVCSPLTICEFFSIPESKKPIFDVVIFDEASQIFTWEALSSIFRAKQVIIAGDSEQMPPSDIFSKRSSDADVEWNEEVEEKITDFDSLLTFAKSKLPELSLKWHYRSKYEELILPSNRFVYKDNLITFPTSDKHCKPIQFIKVENGIWNKGTNEMEADACIKLLEILNREGCKSVGVITINLHQSDLIEKKIETMEHIAKWHEEDEINGLFIKNLENCQGDERDVIVICSSYAKNKDGNVDGRMFSQLNRENAYKRLNVMLTRAKQKVFFLSSLTANEIPETLKSRGVDFLKKYMEFAENGNFALERNNLVKTDIFDSDFEKSVCEALRKELKLDIETQVGCSGYRIDLAVICPNKKDRYILGIECDGEMYHSGKTARERDRLRQDVLESKGWKIHRIWSHDWLYNKEEEIQKIREKLG